MLYRVTHNSYSPPEKINHFEDDNGYDLFVPIRELADGEEVDDE